MDSQAENAQRLLARIDLFEEAVFLTEYNSHGPKSCHEIAPLDLTRALSDVEYKTPLLPPDCLGWSKFQGKERFVIYIPPAPQTVTVLWPGPKVERMTFTFPPLVWIGWGSSYKIFALKARPSELSERLFHAPFPNVDAKGNICWGTANPPAASTRTIHEAFQTFKDSDFNNHQSNGCSEKHREDIRKLWQELSPIDGPLDYPLEDLISTRWVLGAVI